MEPVSFAAEALEVNDFTHELIADHLNEYADLLHRGIGIRSRVDS